MPFRRGYRRAGSPASQPPSKNAPNPAVEPGKINSQKVLQALDQ